MKMMSYRKLLKKIVIICVIILIFTVNIWYIYVRYPTLSWFIKITIHNNKNKHLGIIYF